MAAQLPRVGVAMEAHGGKGPLPGQLATGTGVFPRERVREGHPARAARQIGLVQAADADEVCRERVPERHRQHRAAVAVAFPGAHDDLVPHQVHILHA